MLILPRTVPSMTIGSEPVSVPSMVMLGPMNVAPATCGGRAPRTSRDGWSGSGIFGEKGHWFL